MRAPARDPCVDPVVPLVLGLALLVVALGIVIGVPLYANSTAHHCAPNALHLTSPRIPGTFCEIAIIGGGVGGLHFALQLLDHNLSKPADLCIFERGLKFAGRANDFNWNV